MEEEIEFILETAGRYLLKAPTRADVLSVFVGIRPLVKSGEERYRGAVARSHDSLRRVRAADDDRRQVDDLPEHGGGRGRPGRRLRAARRAALRDAHTQRARVPLQCERFGALSVYGADALGDPGTDARHAVIGGAAACGLPYIGAEVVWAARHEMARTVEDVLARRTRALFLNARAAEAMAPAVARLMAPELDWDDARAVGRSGGIPGAGGRIPRLNR